MELRFPKSEESLREPLVSFRKANVQITGIPEEERKKGADSLFKEIVAERIPWQSSG